MNAEKLIDLAKIASSKKGPFAYVQLRIYDDGSGYLAMFAEDDREIPFYRKGFHNLESQPVLDAAITESEEKKK